MKYLVLFPCLLIIATATRNTFLLVILLVFVFIMLVMTTLKPRFEMKGL
nr:MAG TPA: hypothetical protein [Caudoviricetes sp.]